MNNFDPNHAVWATVLSAAGTAGVWIFAKCAPFLATQIEKLVDAWCKRIEQGGK